MPSEIYSVYHKKAESFYGWKEVGLLIAEERVSTL
jgi:hypothetical protein